MVAEGRIKVGVATRLLESGGLRKMLGPEGVKQTISNAFRHVEVKILEATEEN